MSVTVHVDTIAPYEGYLTVQKLLRVAEDFAKQAQKVSCIVNVTANANLISDLTWWRYWSCRVFEQREVIGEGSDGRRTCAVPRVCELLGQALRWLRLDEAQQFVDQCLEADVPSGQRSFRVGKENYR